MKNKNKIFGIIAIVALIGFTVIAYDTTVDPGGSGNGTVIPPRFFPVSFQGTGTGEFAIDFAGLGIPTKNECPGLPVQGRK